jgi:hypothetical protein
MSPRPGDEVPVQRVVEEQLCDQEARAGVDLLLAVAQVRLADVAWMWTSGKHAAPIAKS